MEKEAGLPPWLYLKEMHCPACSRTFLDTYPRYSRLRLDYIEADLKPSYVAGHIPFLYDITVCFNCGYARLTDSFHDMTQGQRERVRREIMPKFHSRAYPPVLTRDQAEERYKLAHISAQVMGLKASEMAYLMLRTAWFFKVEAEARQVQTNMEIALGRRVLQYYKLAVERFEEAYVGEDFPLRGMSQLTLAYLISLLHYRLKDYDRSHQWLKECYGDGGVHKKENRRIQEKIFALARVWKSEVKARQAQIDELARLEAEVLARE